MQSENEEEKQVAAQEVTRRTFFTYVNMAIGAFIAALLGIPIIGAAILPALAKTKGVDASAGSISDFQVEQPKNVSVTITAKDGWITSQEDRGIWVVKHSESDYTVFNGRCVHLGCAYNWNPDRKEFMCPCHGGVYTINGRVVAGPPPRPLDTLPWKIQQGNLIVNYEDFQLGIPQKVEI